MAVFDWVDFYNEFAHKLLEYKNKRDELVKIVISIYSDTRINMPKLDREGCFTDIDPFTVFGLFNKSSMKESNRKKIIERLKEKFKITSDVPTAFDSIPVLNNLNATYYRFADERGEEEIDNLWNLFSYALEYSSKPTDQNKQGFSKYFDIVIQNKGNGNSKITMGLYWIDSNIFINLDSRNEWYIYESGEIPSKIVNELPIIDKKISASKYFEIVNVLTKFLDSGNLKFKNFQELSYEAWIYSDKVNKGFIDMDKKEESNTLSDEVIDSPRYWIYSPGDHASKWDEFYKEGIMAIGWGEIGNLKQFQSKEKMKEKMREVYDPDLSYKMAAHATWQFANEMKIGDIIFAKKGRDKLVGRGVVTSDYHFNAEGENEYRNFRSVEWTHFGEWDHPGKAAMKVLTDITPYNEYVTELNEIFADDAEDVEDDTKSYSIYTKKEFLRDVYMFEEEYDNLVGVLTTKKNIILQGAPGVGKTFAAKRLAYSIMGEKDTERVKMVQFHQSYSYEDFIMGFRPTEKGFELKKGAFYNFCKEAEVDSEKEYFFIIDEINRGNLSKIFGELFMLIENDKRGIPLQLLYSDEMFSVPNNVYIIGMMNTADRSLAFLDYALRRRFAFIDMKPGYETEGFKIYEKSLDNIQFENLIQCVKDLNDEISKDDSLGDGFCIGHSYFCNLKEDELDQNRLSSIVEYELIPLIREYWFDESDKVTKWSRNLRGAIQ